MCKHKYIPLDLFALQDAKVEAMIGEKGIAAWGVFTAILLKLAQQDEGDYPYSYQINPRTLSRTLPGHPSQALVRSVIYDFGLFIIDEEAGVFYSQRLIQHLQALDEKRVARSSSDVSNTQSEDAPYKTRAKRDLSESAIERMRQGGKKHRPSEGQRKVEEGQKEGSGGTIGGLNAPIRGKNKRVKVKDYLPQSPPGGGEREERLNEKLLRDREELNAALAGISDETERNRVADLLTPPTTDGKIWAQILGAVATDRLRELKDYKPMISYSPKLSREAYNTWRCLTADAKKKLGLELAEGEIPNASDRVLIATTALSLWRSMLHKAAGSRDFLRTNSSMLNLSWLVQYENYVKVASGVYDPTPTPTPSSSTASPNSGRQPLKPYRDADHWSEEHRRGKTFDELDEQEQDLLRRLNPGKYPPKDTPTERATEI